MPNKPLKRCSFPGCAKLVVRGRCPAHLKPRNRKAADEAYARSIQPDTSIFKARKFRSSKRWTRFRAYFRARNPLCQNPFGDHELVAMEDIHHIVGLVADISLALDENNCVSLCRACHAKVEKMERQGKATQGLFTDMETGRGATVDEG